METDIKTEGGIDTTNNGVQQGTDNNGLEEVKISKQDFDTLNQTIGSLKRELKDLKKPKDTEDTQKNPKLSKNDEVVQKLERLALKQAGISHEDDIKLARETSKKWGVDVDELLSDPDFKVKLERQQSEREAITATTDIRGNATTGNAKNTPEYWIAKGTPPSPNDVPDKALRQKIVSQMLAKAKAGDNAKFYND